MKKIASLLVILAMVFVLAACSKSESTEAGKSAETTKAAETTSTPEPTKEAETTKAPEVTKEPEVTKTETTTPTPVETTPEPTEEPDEIDDSEFDEEDYDEYDEFYSPGHEYEGTYVSDDYTLEVMPEGAADIFQVYLGRNANSNEWEAYYQYWTNYYYEDGVETFRSSFGYLIYPDNPDATSQTEDEEIFTVSGDKIIWTTFNDIEFVKATEEDFIEDDGDLQRGTGFGANKYLMDDISGVDILATTFMGVYAENTEDPYLSRYFEYTDEDICLENMDEFDCAYVHFAADDSYGDSVCFIEKGINNYMIWTLKNGTVKIETENDAYFGEFYYEPSESEDGFGSLYLCLHIDEYNIWMITQ